MHGRDKNTLAKASTESIALQQRTYTPDEYRIVPIRRIERELGHAGAGAIIFNLNTLLPSGPGTLTSGRRRPTIWSSTMPPIWHCRCVAIHSCLYIEGDSKIVIEQILGRFKV
jgi:hypothetical protein